MQDIALIISTTLMYSTPLIFAALGGVFSENSGIVNIGIEGMMTIGAFAGAAAGYMLGNPWLAFHNRWFSWRFICFNSCFSNCNF